MNDKKDKALCEKYPNLYRDRNGSMHETSMCWGFTCGEGWYDLIDKLSAKLESEIVKLKEEGIPEEELPAAVQVKEKFGLVRFYMTTETDKMRKLIDEAEEKSSTICECCGKSGSLRTDRYWIKTLCNSCNEEGA